MASLSEMVGNATHVVLATSVVPENGTVGESIATVTAESSSNTAEFQEQLEKILIVVVILDIMLGMGCVTEVSQLLENFRRPCSIIIALLTQFILMPLVAFIFIVVMKVSSLYAIGTILIASCPGGAFSNTFSYLSFGDVSLSICLTMCSSVAALGGLPLSIALYSHAWVDEGDALAVPFREITTTLAVILIPTVLGMLIRWKFPRAAAVIEKVACVTGALGLVAWVVQKCVISSEIFMAPWQAYVLGAVLPVISFSIGFVLSTFFRLQEDRRRSVAIETGCQNIGLALAVIALSYEGFPYRYKIQTVPLLYGLFLLVYASVGITVYRCVLSKRKGDEGEGDDGDKLIEDGDDNDNVRNSSENRKYGSVENDKRSQVELGALPNDVGPGSD